MFHCLQLSLPKKNQFLRLFLAISKVREQIDERLNGRINPFIKILGRICFIFYLFCIISLAIFVTDFCIFEIRCCITFSSNHQYVFCLVRGMFFCIRFSDDNMTLVLIKHFFIFIQIVPLFGFYIICTKRAKWRNGNSVTT